MHKKLEFPRDLIESAMSGDVESLNTLAERVIATVVLFVRAAKSNGHYRFLEEEDVVQDVWVKVDSSLHAYHGGSFKAWLRSIVSHHLVSQLRHHTRQREDRTRTESLQQPLPGTDSDASERILLDVQIGSDGAKAIDSFDILTRAEEFIAGIENVKHRQIAELFYLKGYKYHEISEEIPGIGPGGIGATLNRIRKNLREWFDEAGSQHERA